MTFPDLQAIRNLQKQVRIRVRHLVLIVRVRVRAGECTILQWTATLYQYPADGTPLNWKVFGGLQPSEVVFEGRLHHSATTLPFQRHLRIRSTNLTSGGIHFKTAAQGFNQDFNSFERSFILFLKWSTYCFVVVMYYTNKPALHCFAHYLVATQINVSQAPSETLRLERPAGLVWRLTI